MINQALSYDNDTGSPTSSDASEVWEGLNSEPKRIPWHLLYDDTGVRLLQRIAGLPEYYPARTEVGILKQYRYEMLEDIGPRATIVEWSSGASIKTSLLLDALLEPNIYIPIDVSRQALIRGGAALNRAYPALSVRPIQATNLQPLTLPLSDAERERPIISFLPGSTLGNFEPDAAVEFLATVRAACGKRQRLILGTDLEKAPQLLEAAYNDSSGLTAEFNLRVLDVVNQRFGANFDSSQFVHSAVYRAKHHRVELRLSSLTNQRVTLPQGEVTIAAGEAITTEHCYKFSRERLDFLAERAGFEVTRSWADPEHLFSVQILRPFG